MSISFSFAGALIFMGIYQLLKTALPVKSLFHKGLLYGLITFLIAGVHGALAMTLTLNLPIGLIMAWTLEDILIRSLSGIAGAYILK